VCANQFCNDGAVAATTRNGRPAERVSESSNQPIGSVSAGTVSMAKVTGSVAADAASSTTCRAAWRRAPSHTATPCAYA
jgi:hypothetical protein